MKRERMIDKAKEYQLSTYVSKFVAPVFQQMVRAEVAVNEYWATAIIDGVVGSVWKPIGQCCCITCGKLHPWQSGLGGMHTGHFLASRRHSILFDEDNVAPQSSRCNRYESGAPERFRKWMLAVRGLTAIDRLEKLKTQTRQFTREELVDMRIEYQMRLTEAAQLAKR